MAITASVADYLEAIMMLQREKVNVRSVDILGACDNDSNGCNYAQTS